MKFRRNEIFIEKKLKILLEFRRNDIFHSKNKRKHTFAINISVLRTFKNLWVIDRAKAHTTGSTQLTLIISSYLSI
jgi:hypothetical protein